MPGATTPARFIFIGEDGDLSAWVPRKFGR